MFSKDGFFIDFCGFSKSRLVDHWFCHFQSLLLNGDESNVRGIESCKEVSAEVHVQVHGGNNQVQEEDEESIPEVQIYRTSTTSDEEQPDNGDYDDEAPPRVVVTTAAASGSPPAPQGTKLLV